MQLGVIDTTHFNSTKYPGVCNPSDADTLAVFKNLQAQLNRVAQAGGIAKVTVDGSIGPATVALLAKIVSFLTDSTPSVDPARNILLGTAGYQCTDIASNADMLGNAAQGVADAMSIPPKVSQPSGASTLVSSTGATTKITTATPAAASLVDSLQGMDPMTLLMAAGAVGAVIYFSGGKKRRSRKSTKSSRKHSSRRSNYRYR
jgi:hypothetical protein